ncbi:hypothetical protein EDD37DRAFT_142962 [Exophiala viscosa]|uniref:Uncharacterized protein n=1 Tax=Exophiala viscosa TaxID=2486360 RepID=A0AAN6DPM0_9EURO|nr:hypothetical protein EDD36DRAFT_86601 [Exophiala viscosa]KAI1621056.1 hypothetical protein EDD37DRAFT_142962 [Exophiala viscosa]
MSDTERTVTVESTVTGPRLHSTPDNTPNTGRFTNQVVPGSSVRSLRKPVRLSKNPRRPALSATESTLSGSSTLPSTPLDDIPETLWPQCVIRTSSTPETSDPDLSTDLSMEEITSTRLSVDEQEILTTLPEDVPKKGWTSGKRITRRGITDIWEDQGDRLKQLTQRLKDLPNGFLTLRGRGSPPASDKAGSLRPRISVPMLPRPEITTELCIPTPPDSTDGKKDDRLGMLMDYEGYPRQVESSEEEADKISSLIRSDLQDVMKQERSKGIAVRVPGGYGPGGYEPERLPSHFTSAPTYTFGTSSSTTDFAYTAEDRLLRGRPLRRFGRHAARHSLTGSVEELRSHAFGTRRMSRPCTSSSNRHSVAYTLRQASRSGSRPDTKSESVSSIGGTTIPPARTVAYTDTPKACYDFTWENTQPKNARPPTSSTVASASRMDKDEVLPPMHLELRLGGDLPGYDKIPYFSAVPRPHHEALCGSGIEDVGMHALLKNNSPTVSEVSLHGRTSVQSHLDREAFIKDQNSETPMDTRPPSKGRGMVSKVFFSAWSALHG